MATMEQGTGRVALTVRLGRTVRDKLYRLARASHRRPGNVIEVLILNATEDDLVVLRRRKGEAGVPCEGTE